MRNYDAIMEKMTPEILAEKGVHLVSVDNRRLFYMTSSGQLFTITDYEAALRHEYAWLMHDPQLVEGEPDKNEEESCDRATVEE